jgi:hypothetical protein
MQREYYPCFVGDCLEAATSSDLLRNVPISSVRKSTASPLEGCSSTGGHETAEDLVIMISRRSSKTAASETAKIAGLYS